MKPGKLIPLAQQRILKTASLRSQSDKTNGEDRGKKSKKPDMFLSCADILI